MLDTTAIRQKSQYPLPITLAAGFFVQAPRSGPHVLPLPLSDSRDMASGFAQKFQEKSIAKPTHKFLLTRLCSTNLTATLDVMELVVGFTKTNLASLAALPWFQRQVETSILSVVRPPSAVQYIGSTASSFLMHIAVVYHRPQRGSRWW